MQAINGSQVNGWFGTHSSPPQLLPAGDVRVHSFGMGCACRPVDDGDTIVHNAFDGRERYEIGLARPS